MSVQPAGQGPAIILAIDPGKATGWATFDPAAPEPFNSGVVEGRFQFYAWIRLLAAQGRALEVVIESFTINQRTLATDRDYNALYIIGYIEAVCEVNGWAFSTQMPGVAKGFSSNEKLNLLGWRNPGPGGHADDAARHLLAYVATKRTDLAEPIMRRLMDGGLR